MYKSQCCFLLPFSSAAVTTLPAAKADFLDIWVPIKDIIQELWTMTLLLLLLPCTISFQMRIPWMKIELQTLVKGQFVFPTFPRGNFFQDQSSREDGLFPSMLPWSFLRQIWETQQTSIPELRSTINELETNDPLFPFQCTNQTNQEKRLLHAGVGIDN